MARLRSSGGVVNAFQVREMGSMYGGDDRLQSHVPLILWSRHLFEAGAKPTYRRPEVVMDKCWRVSLR